MWLYRIYEFLFDRWTVSILEEGEERVYAGYDELYGFHLYEDVKFIRYKLTHKFNGSEKIKIKYLN